MYDFPEDILEKFYLVYSLRITLIEFEDWLYAEKTLETILSEEDYLNLVSINYKKLESNSCLNELLISNFIQPKSFSAWNDVLIEKERSVFTEFIIDVQEIASVTEFWNKYVDVIDSEGIHYFGKNLDALWDALSAGGPGYPDSDNFIIRVSGSDSLKKFGNGDFYNSLKRIENDLRKNINSTNIFELI